MTVKNPIPKEFIRPITTGANSAMSQSEFPVVYCNLPQLREKSLVQGTIGFGFASHLLKIWLKMFLPFTKHSNHNGILTLCIENYKTRKLLCMKIQLKTIPDSEAERRLIFKLY